MPMGDPKMFDPDGGFVSPEEKKARQEEAEKRVPELEEVVAQKESEIAEMVEAKKAENKEYVEYVEEQFRRTRDLERYKRQLVEAKKAVEYDEVTGLMMGKRFQLELKKVLVSMSKEHRAQPDLGAVLAIDLNGLKAVNDTFGHDAGDKIIIEFANVLLESVRMGDFVARTYSTGDEFQIFLRNADYRTAGYELAKRIIENSKKLRKSEAGADFLGFAMGVEGIKHDLSVNELVEKADLAEVAAKKSMKGIHHRSVLAFSNPDNPEEYKIADEDEILAYQEQTHSD